MAQQVWTTTITQRELSDQAAEQQGSALTSPAATQIDPENQNPASETFRKGAWREYITWKGTQGHPWREKDKTDSKKPPQTAAEAGSRQQDAARPVSGMSINVCYCCNVIFLVHTRFAPLAKTKG